MPALKINEGCTGTSFQLLFFLRISEFFHSICPNVTPFSGVFFHSTSLGIERNLSVHGGGTLLIKAKIDWAGSGCFEAKGPPDSLAADTQAWCNSLGSFFSCPFPCL